MIPMGENFEPPVFTCPIHQLPIGILYIANSNLDFVELICKMNCKTRRYTI